MINRENLGTVEGMGRWATLSVPDPVKAHFDKLVARRPDIRAEKMGRGYHNAGWAYTEYRIVAISQSHAQEVADWLWMEISWELQGGNR